MSPRCLHGHRYRGHAAVILTILTVLEAGVLEAGVLEAGALVAQEPRGYQPRACGFDLDDDGILGEPRDDCRLCNGRDGDPDGDGSHEDLIYVDCDQGSDTTTCGSPQTPCATIGWAWSQRADGTADGAEDVVCFRGICREQGLRPATGGLAGTREVAAGGSAARAWRYPTQPAMLVGWDRDADGVYPPTDTDDVAVIEGMGLGRAFQLEAGADYLEMAHFSIRDFGRGSRAENSGFVGFGPTVHTLENLYFHDLALSGINRGRVPGSSVSTINLIAETARLRWLSFENLLVEDNGGWFARGFGPHGAPRDPQTPPVPFFAEPDVGPWRWRQITRTAHGCDFSECGRGAASTVFKFWGYVTGIEILDSVWDANVAHWQPSPIGGPFGAAFVYAAQCTRDWTIRNNLVIDHKGVLRIGGFSPEYCTGSQARPLDHVVFDRNETRNTYEPWALGDVAVHLDVGGDDPGEVIGDVAITHNVFSTTTGWEACFWLQGGNDAAPPRGRITFSDNVCWGTPNRFAAVLIGSPEGEPVKYPHQQVVFEHNVLGGIGRGQLNLRAIYAPEQWRAGGNVYDPDAGFSWAGKTYEDFGTFRAASGGEPGSQTCQPGFADPAKGIFTLEPGASRKDAEGCMVRKDAWHLVGTL